MNQLDVERMHTNVTVLGWLHIVGNGLMFLVGGFIFIVLWIVGVAVGDPIATRVLLVVGTAVGGLLLLLGVPGVLGGIGLLARKQWGRILALIVGFLGLLNFPIGTAIGIYTAWVLLQDAASDYFSS